MKTLLRWSLPLCTLCFAAGIALGCYAMPGLWLLIPIACALMGMLLLENRLRLIGIAALCLSLGISVSSMDRHPALPPAGEAEITGTVVSEININASGKAVMRLGDALLDDQPLPYDVYWSIPASELPFDLEPGSRWSIRTQVYHPRPHGNPGGFDFRTFLAARGIRLAASGAADISPEPPGFSVRGWLAALRHRLTLQLTAHMGPTLGGYAAAMLIGTRELIPVNERDAFSRVGVAHLLSISGLHVGILAGMIAWLLRRSKKRGLVFGITAAVLFAYAMLTGFNAPVVRAALLVIFHQAGRLMKRRVNGLWTLSLAMLVMLLHRPAQLMDAGFQLSYAAVLGLMLIAPWLRSHLHPQSKAGRWLSDAACACLGAQLGVLLPQLYWFQELPILGLLLNLLLIPFAVIPMALGWIALLTGWIPWLSGITAIPAAASLSLLRSVVLRADALGAVTLWTHQANPLTAVGWVLLLLALSCIHRLTIRPRLIVGLAGALVLVLSLIPLHSGTSYIQLDVGNADAAVLQDGTTVLVIDTGSDGLALADYLQQQRLSVDGLVLTHLHSDHAGGLRTLIDRKLPIKTLYLAEQAELSDIDDGLTGLIDRLIASGTVLQRVAAGDRIDLPSGHLDFLWPMRGGIRPGHDANDYSLTARLTIGSSSLLMTGDLSGRYERYAAYPSDVLKAAHHGSDASSSATFVQAVDPDLVLLSNGDAAREHRFRNRTERKTLSTLDCGAITLRFLREGIEVSTFFGAEGK